MRSARICKAIAVEDKAMPIAAMAALGQPILKPQAKPAKGKVVAKSGEEIDDVTINYYGDGKTVRDTTVYFYNGDVRASDATNRTGLERSATYWGDAIVSIRFFTSSSGIGTGLTPPRNPVMPAPMPAPIEAAGGRTPGVEDGSGLSSHLVAAVRGSAR